MQLGASLGLTLSSFLCTNLPWLNFPQGLGHNQLLNKSEYHELAVVSIEKPLVCSQQLVMNS
jgi:hypothetical protein